MSNDSHRLRLEARIHPRGRESWARRCRDGLDVETLPAGRSRPPRYAGVVVGGSIYMGRWHPDAIGLLQRHASRARGAAARGLRAWARRRSSSTTSMARWRSCAGRSRRSPRSSRRAVAIFGGVIDPRRSASRSAGCRRATPATGRRSGPGPRGRAVIFDYGKPASDREGSPQRASADAPMSDGPAGGEAGATKVRARTSETRPRRKGSLTCARYSKSVESSPRQCSSRSASPRSSWASTDAARFATASSSSRSSARPT